MELNEYLDKNPWPGELLQLSKPVEYYFTYDFDLSPEELWPLVSDTSRVNKHMNLSRVAYNEIEGKLYGKSRIAGRIHEWLETPWQWEYAKSMTGERIYSKGYFRYLRANYIIENKGNGRSSLTIYFGWIPGGLAGRILLTLARKNFGADFHRAVNEVIKSANQSVPMFMLTEPSGSMLYSTNEKNSDNSERVHSIKRQLIAEGIDPDVTEKLSDYIIKAPDDKLYRIRPIPLAREMNIDRLNLLNVMLHSTRKGLLNMTWDTICPHCQGLRERASHLWEVKKDARCDVCRIDFDTSGINSIEITFHPNPEIRKVNEVLYCSAEPAKKAHILFQREIKPGGQYSCPADFPDGLYRMRIQGEINFNILDLNMENTSGTILWDNNISSGNYRITRGGSILIENISDIPQTYIIEEDKTDTDALRPRDIFAFQDFRDIFSEESLSLDLSIDVGVQNILFVDIVKSTELYSREGNSKAFSLVRDYFSKSHSIARANNGTIVKTMGDAVLLAFIDPIDALKSAVTFQKKFNGTGSGNFITRITINRGPCLAVNLNNGIDYFGQTVNIAAKLQNYAGGGDIVFTRDFYEDENVKKYLLQHGFKEKALKEAEVKGAGIIGYHSIKIRSGKST